MKVLLLLACALGTCGIGCARPTGEPLPPPVYDATEAGGAAATEVPVPVGWKTHLEPGELELSYPADCALTTGATAGAGQLGTPLVRVALPETQFGEKKTNLVEAYLVVGVSSEAGAATTCSTFSDLQGQGDNRKPKSVRGVEFVSRSSMEAAAGNLYDSRLYRALRAGRCYEVALIVHTGNIGNYDPGAVEKFDNERAFAALEPIFETLRLLR